MCTFFFHAQTVCLGTQKGSIALGKDAGTLRGAAPGLSCPERARPAPAQNYFGRKIAVDASMHIYAFLVSGRSVAGRCRVAGMGVPRTAEG